MRDVGAIGPLYSHGESDGGEGGDDGVVAAGLAPKGAAASGGVKEGDKIYQINDKKITSRVDIKLALLNKKPGEEVTLHVNRRKFLWGTQQVEISFELGK